MLTLSWDTFASTAFVSIAGGLNGSVKPSKRCLFEGGFKIPFRTRLLYVLRGGPDLLLLLSVEVCGIERVCGEDLGFERSIFASAVASLPRSNDDSG